MVRAMDATKGDEIGRWFAGNCGLWRNGNNNVVSHIGTPLQILTFK